MKEPELHFHNNDEPEIIVVEEDKKKEILKEAQDLCMSANELYERLKNNKLEKGFCNTLLSLFEIYTVKLHELFDYKSVLKKEYDERHEEIRAITKQNRELRRQLGDKVSPEDIRESLKNLTETIHAWWKKEGFGYVPDVAFYPYVCRVKLSGSMSIHYNKSQPDLLRQKGYEIAEPERDSFVLVHSEKNISFLTSEIVRRFPSAKITKIELSNWNLMHIREVEMLIKDYSDISEIK